MPVDRIAAYIGGGSEDSFDELARSAFAFQYRRIAPYRALCDRHGASPETVEGWRRVPMVPALAFRGLELAADEPVERFRAPVEGEGEPSVHHHPYPDLYRTALDHSFPTACLGGLERPPALSLVPPRELQPDSSLSFMADHLLRRWAAPDSAVTVGRRGVEVARARSFLAARQRDRRPTLLLATAASLGRLLAALGRRGLRFRLPAGSRLLVSGGDEDPGWPGASESPRRELLEQVAAGLAVAPDAVVHDYGRTELTSRLYAGHGRAGEPRPLRPPPWVRLRLLDPQTLSEAPAGTPGLIAVFDLANVGSAIHLVTGELGIAAGDGVALAGRATGAELRACATAAEELAALAADAATG